MTKVRSKKGAKKKASKRKSDPRNIPAMRKRMWKPGQSGNPKGRTPGKTIEEIVLNMMDHKVGRGKDAMTRMEMLATVIVDEVISRRNPKLIKEVLDRLWPKGVDVNVTAKGGFKIIYLDEQDKSS